MRYVPYVYVIKNYTTGLKYIGVRYAKGCHPNDFWLHYFTSSSAVQKLIEEFGLNDFYIRILHKFPDRPDLAIKREAQYFPLIQKRNDYLNMTYSSGLQDLRIASKGGKVGGALVYARKIGIFRNDEERKIWAAAAGKIGGLKQKELGIGIHGLDEKTRIQNAKKGNAACKAQGKGRWNSKTQAELGKKGGPKNKGFKWYNNGIHEYKYTKAEQAKIPYIQFLQENKFLPGRILRDDIICPYCSKKGKSYPAMRKHHYDNCKRKKNEN